MTFKTFFASYLNVTSCIEQYQIKDRLISFHFILITLPSLSHNLPLKESKSFPLTNIFYESHFFRHPVYVLPILIYASFYLIVFGPTGVLHT